MTIPFWTAHPCTVGVIAATALAGVTLGLAWRATRNTQPRRDRHHE